MKDLNLAGFKSHASMPSFADDQFTIQKSSCFWVPQHFMVSRTNYAEDGALKPFNDYSDWSRTSWFSIKNNITAEDV